MRYLGIRWLGCFIRQFGELIDKKAKNKCKSCFLFHNSAQIAYRLLCRLPEMIRCCRDLKRKTSELRLPACLVERPCTLARHFFQLLGCISCFINSMTSLSDTPNWAFMASKGVRSSQAISIIRSMSASLN